MCAAGDRNGAPAPPLPRARALALALAARRTKHQHLAPQLAPVLLQGGGRLWAGCSVDASLWHVLGVSLGCFFHQVSRVLAARLASICLGLQMVVGPWGVVWEGHRHAAGGGTLGSCADGWGLECGLWGPKSPCKILQFFWGSPPWFNLMASTLAELGQGWHAWAR